MEVRIDLDYLRNHEGPRARTHAELIELSTATLEISLTGDGPHITGIPEVADAILSCLADEGELKTDMDEAGS